MNINKNYFIISVHSRKQHNLEQALVLYQLYSKGFRHITSIYFGNSFIGRVKSISKNIAETMKKRSIPGLPCNAVVKFSFTEIKRKLASKFRYYYSPYMQDRDFQKTVIKKIAPPKICISYDGQSYLLFKAWKGKTKLVLDLTVALPQYMLVTEHGKNYKVSMLSPEDEFHQRLYSNYFTEIDLADIILCGSEFVKQSVVFFRPEFEPKCRILPYGVETALFSFPERAFDERTNLKFVAVGTVDRRKGSDLLIEVWKEYNHLYPGAELHFFGAVNAEEINSDTIPQNIILHGRVSTQELVNALKEMDVFVLPTLHEGSSIAVYQAMAMQLPVITTFNSGTVLKHGESCEMIEAGNANELAAALNKLSEDFAYRKQLGTNAFNLSKQYSWEDYKYRLAQILEEFKSEVA